MVRSRPPEIPRSMITTGTALELVKSAEDYHSTAKSGISKKMATNFSFCWNAFYKTGCELINVYALTHFELIASHLANSILTMTSNRLEQSEVDSEEIQHPTSNFVWSTA